MKTRKLKTRNTMSHKDHMTLALIMGFAALASACILGTMIAGVL